jgi:hypothetical protein
MGFKDDMSPAEPRTVRLAKGQEVSLGCGTLILIALIVMFFSGRSSNVGNELRRVESELRSLRQSVDEMNNDVQKLHRKIDVLGNN